MDGGVDSVERPGPLVQEKLTTPQTPEVIGSKSTRDFEGRNYELYRCNLTTGEPVEVIFQASDGLTPPELITSNHAIILGEKPVWQSPNTWDDWQKRFDGRQSAQLESRLQLHALSQFSREGGLTFIVSQNPQAILEMALLLGTIDPRVRQWYHQARTMHYSNELLTQIDRVIAAKKIDVGGTPKEQSHDAEALFLASLLGDKESDTLLNRLNQKYQAEDVVGYQQKKQQLILHEIDTLGQQRSEEERKSIDERRRIDKERHGLLKVEELLTVHVTQFYPFFDKESKTWRIRTTFNATEGKAPRIGVHFTLNHPVASHMYGNWDDKEVIILAPLQDMIKANGLPNNINTVDTWWIANPGQDLILPETAVVMVPGPTKQEVGASQGDVAHLRHRGPEGGLNRINYRLEELDLKKIAQLQDRLKQLNEQLNQKPHQPRVGLGEEWNNTRVEFDKERLRKVSSRKSVIRQVIQSMGFEPHYGGSWAWDGDSWEATAQTMLLAEQLGTVSGAHTDSWDHNYFEEPIRFYGGDLYRVSTGQISIQDLVQATMNFQNGLKKYWDFLSPQHRRAMWVTGLL